MHAAPIEADFILSGTVRIVDTFGNNLGALTQLTGEILQTVPVHQTLGWWWQTTPFLAAMPLIDTVDVLVTSPGWHTIRLTTSSPNGSLPTQATI